MAGRADTSRARALGQALSETLHGHQLSEPSEQLYEVAVMTISVPWDEAQEKSGKLPKVSSEGAGTEPALPGSEPAPPLFTH